MLGVIASSRRKIREDYYQLFKDRVLADSGTFIENPIVFNNEKLLLTPNAYKEDVIYAALPKDGSGDFSFSRNSSATYIEDGIIKTALPNVPRFQDGKILIEGQATNLIARSQVGTGWIVQASTIITPNSDISPDGTMNASKYEVDTTGKYLRPVGSISVTELTLYTYSFYIKNIDLTSIYNRVYDNSNMSDLVKRDYIGEISSTEWTRVIVEFTTPLGCTEVIIYPLMGSSVGSFYLYGNMLEAGKATSYIPTNGTIVTRLADIATVTTPAGVTEIIETIDDVEQSPITTIPPTYQLPVGKINNIIMK